MGLRFPVPLLSIMVGPPAALLLRCKAKATTHPPEQRRGLSLLWQCQARRQKDPEKHVHSDACLLLLLHAFIGFLCGGCVWWTRWLPVGGV